MRQRGVEVAGLALALVMVGASARAQDAMGPGRTGLPGFVSLPSATSGPPAVNLSASGGYGYIEPLEDSAGDHHRLLGDTTLSVAPLEWLGAYLRFAGRHDVHAADGLGPDDSTVGEPWLGVRVGGLVLDWLGLGFDAALWFPGAAAPSLVLEATSFEGRAVATIAPAAERYQIAISAGARLDQSAASVDDASALRQGDRVSLGVGRTHALLLGVAFAAQPLEDVSLVGEVRWDPWLGDGAPPIETSPLTAAALVRVQVVPGLWAETGVEALLTPRPNDPSGVQVAVIPRVSAHLGLRGVLAFEGAPQTAEEPEQVAPEPAAPAVLRGRLVDPDGAPIAGAGVRLIRDGGSEPLAETRSGSGGEFELEAPSDSGPWELVFEAEGYAPMRRSGSALTAPITLSPNAPRGTLRGLVRDFDGEPLQATVRVDEATVDTAADGTFELDLPPGRYTVEITARGFQEQRRPVRVEEGGVTILNADLRQRRR